MLKKLTLFLLVSLLATSLFAQGSKYVLRANGDLQKLVNNSDIRKAVKSSDVKTLDGKAVSHHFASAAGTIDTLTVHDRQTVIASNAFVFYGQDVMMQWFVAPADLIVKAAGFAWRGDPDDPSTTVSVRLIKLNWTEEELLSVETPVTMGYYPSDGDGANNTAALPEDATGDWVDLTDGAYPSPPWDHPDFDLWSDVGFGFPINPVAQASAYDYQWVEMMELGFEPTVDAGEVFAIVAINDGAYDVNGVEGVTQYYGSSSGGYSGWKYYEAGPGWRHREYTWDYSVIVELTSDRAPVISDVTSLPTTLDLGPFTVNATITDDNPSGGDFGVDVAKLKYTINGGAEQEVDMTGSEPDFTGELPAGSAGDVYSYWVEATDVGGNTAASAPLSFSIFKPTEGVPTLVVYNGEDGIEYPESYYFRKAADFQYDVWAYGPLTSDLVDNYNHIFELCLNGPADYNNDVIRTWLESSGDNDYFLAGMEWLGNNTGFTDSTYAPGTFEYDILGVAHSYNDVTNTTGGANGGEQLPSLLLAQEGTQLGGALYTDYTASGNDSLKYDPVYEIGFYNWMDAFDVVEGVTVDVMTETRGIQYAPDVQTLPATAHHELAGGNKVAFQTFDPISINTSPTYIWFGDSTVAPHYQALEWFDPVVGVEDEPVKNEFSLSQNYPNPFNPATVIKYSLTENTKVSLKVYDILGKEVATLIDETQARGVHEFNFNASNLASGMYIYTLKAGDFVSSKKMMLLK